MTQPHRAFPATSRLARVAPSFLAGLMLLSGVAFALEWQGVRQMVTIGSEGGVVVRDDRTAVADTPFQTVSLFVPLAEGETLELLPASRAMDPGQTARFEVEDVPGGMLLSATGAGLSRQLRLRFHYRLSGALEVYEDVVAFERVLVTTQETPVQDYRLWIRAPGPMEAPYDAFVHRLNFGILPESDMSEDRSDLRVHFEQVPAGAGVEVRYLMDPDLFAMRGDTPALRALLRDEFFVTGIDNLRRSSLWGLGALVLLVLLGVRVILAVMRFRRKPELEERPEYRPPNYLPPATVALLAGNSPSAGMQATLLDLARRGLVELEPRGKGLGVHVLGDEAKLESFERRLALHPEPGAHPDWHQEVKCWLEANLGMTLMDPDSVKAARRYSRLALALLVISLAGIVLTVGSPRFLFILCAPLALALALVARRKLAAWRTDVKLLAHLWRRFGGLLASKPLLERAPDAFLEGWLELHPYAVALGVAEPFLQNLEEVATDRGLGLPQLAPTHAPPAAKDGPVLGMRHLSRTLQTAFSTADMKSG